MLPDGPATVLHGPHLPVNLAQQGNITPAGLLGKLAARGGRIGLARVQAPAGSGPMPAVGRLVVVSQQQDAPVRVEHDDPARAPQPGPAGVRQPGGGQALGLVSVHVLIVPGTLGRRAGRRASIRTGKPGEVLTIGVMA